MGLLHQLVNSFISVYATMTWYPAETNMRAFVIQQPKEVHDMANKRVLSVFNPQLSASRILSQSKLLHRGGLGPCVGIVQCQSDGCSLSSKDGAAVWQSFGQEAAGCFTLWKWRLITAAAPILPYTAIMLWNFSETNLVVRFFADDM